ncbi:hypothetical protein [Parasphingorhabdus cellanae]|uniref:Lipid/polyisoprenoid-binding YceI-like domain-containing protein n=1 Tax=Parasphingorhabdus cellanae TaxID=2806553 RepID=A0ABX7T3P7_9SPHN|nr:hypothetical protein [Parasphingorhabdus cellanae]QTD55751.1 hypothetical protein J4G78_16415 [Parasphingorhabdus cellanae]
MTIYRLPVTFPLLLVSSSLLLSAPALAQTPLQQAMKAPTNGPVYSYDISYQTPKISAAGRVDPTRPVGKRVTVNRPAKSAWTKEFKEAVAEAEKNGDKDFWCSAMFESIPANARLISQTAATATYAFKPKLNMENKDDAKFTKNLTGTVTIDKENPAILSYRLTAPKSFKINLLARIKSFSLDLRCARAPDGRTYVKSSEVKVSGSALGKNFSENRLQKHSGLRRVSR